jgi:hypothetical protein
VTHPRRATAAVLLTLAVACGAGSPARLELGAVATEAGASRTVIARVEMRNAGARELLLHGVRLDCGCRLDAALPDALAGGERATLVVRCRSGGDATARPREIRLSSSDRERPEVVVGVPLPESGRVLAEPPALYFGYVPVGASAARDLALPADGAGAADAPPIARAPELQIEPRPSRADGRRVVRVRFAPRAAGPFRGTLALGREVDAVPVSGIGYRSVLAFPAEVTLPSEVTAGAPPPVTLKNVGAAPFEITAVEVPPGLAADLLTTAPGREFRLVLRAHGRLAAEGGAIRLHTSDPDEPLVTIPVRDGDV